MSTTFVQDLAAFAIGLRLDDVPETVVDASARLLADTLACAIAAAADPDAPAVAIMQAQAELERFRPEATVVGTNLKTSARGAALANCTMARYLDANDIYMPPTGSLSGSGHFSDASPAVLAVAEWAGAAGAELLEALVVSYEVQAALADSMAWLDRGFHSVSQVTVATALAAGRLLGLNEQQLAHAASLAVTSGTFIQTWLRPSADVPALKGGAPGLAGERGILCAELAGRGFTGPLDALETFFEQFGGECVNSAGRDRLGSEWTVPRNAIKAAPAQIYTQAIIQCAEQLHDQGLRLGELDELTVYSNDGACGRVQGSPGAFAPASREAADHSTPYVIAMTLRDGSVSLDTYTGGDWLDAGLRHAMSKIRLVIDPHWEARREEGVLGGAVEARDRSGLHYRAEVQQFRGHPDNPLSEAELVAKLEAFVGRSSTGAAGSGEALLNHCRNLAAMPSVEPLVQHLVASGDREGR